jgi:hypothetical protein
MEAANPGDGEQAENAPRDLRRATGEFMKTKLIKPNLETRREFLKSAARKAVVPVVVAYTIGKSTPKLFAREPD